MHASPAAPAETTQPRGLYVLFFAEMWERFSFYGMRALLVLYLTQHLKLDREHALEIYGIYTGIVYITPYVGGLLADRVLGARKAILIGGCVMALGHLAMAVESLLYPALGLLIVGNGFFKPNISSIVGELYRPGDPRRDGGFTIFYMGINIGAFLSPLVCGTLGETVSWHLGFASAGVGMILGLIVFVAGQKLLGQAGYPPDMNRPPAGTPLRRKDWIHVAIGTVLSVATVAAVLGLWQVVGPAVSAAPSWMRIVVGLGIIAALLWGALGGAIAEGKEALHRHIAIIVMCFFVIFFWAGFEQAGGTMNLFAYEQTDRHFLGWEVPASWLQSVNSMFIVLLAPLFSLMWPRIAASRVPSSSPYKMSAGLMFLGVGFVVMYAAQNLAVSRDEGDVAGQVGLLWLVAVYFMHTVAELCISPIGLSMTTKLAVPRMASLMMGVWFVATGLANYVAGTLEALLKDFNVPLYGFLVGSSVAAGVILLMLSPWLTKWSYGRD